MICKSLIIGSTGLVGNEALQILIQSSSIDAIHSISRKKIFQTPSPKVTEHILNFEDLASLTEALNGQFTETDFAICCLGTTIKTAGSSEAFRKVDYQYVLDFANLCKNIGIKNFGVVSAIGASTKSSVFYSRVKGEMEESLAKLNFERLIIAHPGLLLGKRKEFRAGEKIAVLMTPLFNWALMGPLAKYRSVQALDVAKSLIKNLMSQNKTKGTFYLEGESLIAESQTL